MTTILPYLTLDQLVPKFAEWAEERNLVKGSDPFRQMVKLMEELGELANGIARQDKIKIEDSFGDMLVIMTIITRQLGLSLTASANLAWHEIKDRKGRMIDGVFIKEADLTPEQAQ